MTRNHDVHTWKLLQFALTALMKILGVKNDQRKKKRNVGRFNVMDEKT